MTDNIQLLIDDDYSAPALEQSRFLKLLTRAADSDDSLNDKERGEIRRLRTAHAPGFTWPELADGVRRHARLADAVADLPVAQKELDEVRDRHRINREKWHLAASGGEHSPARLALMGRSGIRVPEDATPDDLATSKAKMEKLDEEMETIRRDKARLQARVDQAESAASQRNEIEQKYWFLFGLADPAKAEATAREAQDVKSRKRHVAHLLRDEDLGSSSPYQVIYIEHIMLRPDLHPKMHEFIFEPMPGQSVDDLNALQALALKIAQSEKPHRYLSKRLAVSPLHKSVARDCTVYADDEIDTVTRGRPTHVDVVYVPLPGQTQREVNQMLRELSEAHESVSRRMNGESLMAATASKEMLVK